MPRSLGFSGGSSGHSGAFKAIFTSSLLEREMLKEPSSLKVKMGALEVVGANDNGLC